MLLLIATCALVASAHAQVGSSGIVSADGNNVQFSQAFADDILFSGPSGIITKSGKNRQLTHSQAAAAPHHHVPIPILRAPAHPLVGPSAILHADGTATQFTHHQATNAAVIGASGIVGKDGVNTQFRVKRAVNEHGDIVGDSGVVSSDGQLLQLTEPGVKVVARGPSAILLSNGQAIQLKGRKKRSVNEHGDIVGDSGVISSDGQQLQLTAPGVKVVARGPSAILLSNGQAIQLKGRKKRSVNAFGDVVAPSAIIFANGQVVQLTEAGVGIASRGESGAVLTNGQQVQFTH